ncbi:MAG TPA: hypothetical protein VFP54_00970 [Acidimicrobiales bacterium]|nr:hypothetical protein [Acidimicrobiales bacterium]
MPGRAGPVHTRGCTRTPPEGGGCQVLVDGYGAEDNPVTPTAMEASPGRAGDRAAWHQRMDAAEELLEAARAYGPSAVATHPALDSLGGLDGALRYLHGRWVTLFGVAIDQGLDAWRMPVLDTAWRAWKELAAAQPVLAAVLVHHGRHAAVRQADVSHRRLLASVSGVPRAQLPGFCPARTGCSRPGLLQPAGGGVGGGRAEAPAPAGG